MARQFGEREIHRGANSSPSRIASERTGQSAPVNVVATETKAISFGRRWCGIVFRTGGSSSARPRRLLLAVAVVNRLPATLGYNLAYLLVGVALALPALRSGDLALVAWFGLAVFLAKMQASVADAIHDQAVDANNPEKSRIARSVAAIGRERLWTLLVAELVAAGVAFGVVAMRSGEPVVLAVGAATALLGFLYSYPPRIKEQGLLNHVVTTGVDVCFVVLPIPYLVVGALTPHALVVGAMVALYAFAYHVVHQAADIYYDGRDGVSTFARSLGAARSMALSALLTGIAALLGVAAGHFVAAAVATVVTAHYAAIYRSVRAEPPDRQSAVISSRFAIGRAATALNLAMGVSLLVDAGVGPVLP